MISIVYCAALPSIFFVITITLTKVYGCDSCLIAGIELHWVYLFHIFPSLPLSLVISVYVPHENILAIFFPKSLVANLSPSIRLLSL